MAEQPFKIAVSDEQLDLLHKKLALSRLPDELDGANLEYDVQPAHMQHIPARWNATAAEFNAEPAMFTRDDSVDGHEALSIHCVRKRVA